MNRSDNDTHLLRLYIAENKQLRDELADAQDKLANQCASPLRVKELEEQLAKINEANVIKQGKNKTILEAIKHLLDLMNNLNKGEI